MTVLRLPTPTSPSTPPITEEWLREVADALRAAGITWHAWRNEKSGEFEPHHYAVKHSQDDGRGPIFVPCYMVKTRGQLRSPPR